MNKFIPNNSNKCEFCSKRCGYIYELVCKCKIKLCGECLDDVYDNIHDNTNHDDIIFICPKCDKKITKFKILK